MWGGFSKEFSENRNDFSSLLKPVCVCVRARVFVCVCGATATALLFLPFIMSPSFSSSLVIIMKTLIKHPSDPFCRPHTKSVDSLYACWNDMSHSPPALVRAGRSPGVLFQGSRTTEVGKLSTLFQQLCPPVSQSPALPSTVPLSLYLSFSCC